MRLLGKAAFNRGMHPTANRVAFIVHHWSPRVMPGIRQLPYSDKCLSFPKENLHEYTEREHDGHPQAI